jgi:hypothetical protein
MMSPDQAILLDLGRIADLFVTLFFFVLAHRTIRAKAWVSILCSAKKDGQHTTAINVLPFPKAKTFCAMRLEPDRTQCHEGFQQLVTYNSPGE